MLREIKAWLRLDIERLPPEETVVLPTNLLAFAWYFMRQAKGVLITMMTLELLLALALSAAFWYVGLLVAEGNYTTPLLLGGAAILIGRYFTRLALFWMNEIVFMPHFGNLVRRQVFWYVSRHSLAYFQNDFAGRIGQKLLQSAPSLRDALRSSIGAVWFVAIFTISNLWILSDINFWLALPMYIWVVGYIFMLWFFVPKVKRLATLHSEDMSQLTGQTVDIFTNFLLCKFFARIKHEDGRVVGLLHRHSASFKKTNKVIALLGACMETWNILLLTTTAWVGYLLLANNGIEIAALAIALPMALQATFQAGWIMNEVSSIFENLGTVQEGIDTLAKPHTVTDEAGAKELVVTPATADIAYSGVHFHYGQEDGVRVMEDFTLHIPAGQKVGIVGRSGAGKSTLTTLLVRAFDVEAGDIRIAGQNIAEITQDSLRRAITTVTQESYMFHRSVFDNIAYGKPDATEAEVEAAAKAASAHDFIQLLSDAKGRTGYAAHVGERGVKLSGGQKQRIAIARAILKDAPILVLDEATSALDSESEVAIQHALEEVMTDKTVIAIAHRLSTLQQMDRIIVMDQGRIVEDGTHSTLIAQNGTYADLWAHQTGGYLQE